MKCRHCALPLEHVFLDLGFAPPSNAYLSKHQLHEPETWFPLKLFVCSHCWLVQTEDYASAADLFNMDYAYFSSTSVSWLEHAKRYVDMILKRLGLNEKSFVVEIASNDGYLLKNFVAAGVPCLGIEPTDSTAAAAEKLEIPVLRKFFGESLAGELATAGKQTDLILGNNVYAHVPDINDFTAGMKTLLKPGGTITLEFPHLLQLIRERQFDTVYHEHFSYLSLSTVKRIFESHGLRIWDVEPLPTHGGSLRIYGCHANAPHNTSTAVTVTIAEEIAAGLDTLGAYQSLQTQAERIKHDLLSFLIEQKRAGKSIAAFGAAAKGNTLFNFAGVRPDLLAYVCDAASSKQGKFLPGSHIPILAPDALKQTRPDYLLLLPWNIADELVTLHSYVRDWGCRFVTTVPELRVLP